MKAIVENPYRVLGLECGASERDIARRATELKVFLEMGKTRSYENDFSAIWPLSRSLDSVQAAISRLESAEDRDRHSVFWFWEKTPIDRLALETLRRGEAGQALNLWTKALSGPNLRQNLSHYRNISILHMGLMTKSGTFALKHCNASITTAATYFSSPDAEGVVPGDVVVQTPLAKRAKYFVEEFFLAIEKQIDKPGGPSKHVLLGALAGFPSEIRNDATVKLLAAPFQTIRAAVEKASTNRARSPLKGCSIGNHLLASTRFSLEELRGALGDTDPRYTVPADNIANEALQCSIDHFNAASPSQIAPIIVSAIAIADSAEQLASSDIIQRRARETAAVYRRQEEQATGKPASPNIRVLVRDIASRIEDLPEPGDLTQEQLLVLPRLLRGFLDVVVPSLNSVAAISGKRDADFLRASSRVAEAVLDRLAALSSVGGCASPEIVALLDRVGQMEMLPVTRDIRDEMRVNAAIALRRKGTTTSRSSANAQVSGRQGLERVKGLLTRLISGVSAA
jgi:hypothetical protein